MRLICTIYFVLFLISTSIGQTFTLSELIKMPKMDMDNFDTYVTAKGFVFVRDINLEEAKGVTYALNLNRNDKRNADKFIKWYSKYFSNRYAINYQSNDKNEYIKFKSQISILGFKFIKTDIIIDEFGLKNNYFKYRKGKEEISIFTSSEDFEISYKVDY